MKTSLFTCLTLLISLFAKADHEGIWEQKIYQENIRSLEFKGEGDRQLYPVLQLGTEQELHLDFDDLDGELKDYQFTIIHCNYDWTESPLLQNEYIDGLFSDYLMDNESSFNTYVEYTHYHLTFPSPSLKPKVSGNYILKIYEDSDPEKVVMSLRFFVFQQLTNIKMDINRPIYTKYYDSHQEIDVTVNTMSQDVINVHTDYKLLLMQNGRWDNAITNLQPRFFNDKQLDYNYEEVNTFEGGKEFRAFDTRDLRFGGRNIKVVRQDSQSVYNALLYGDKDRSGESYLDFRDFNGHRLIDAKSVSDEQVEGDYAWVHFRLLSDGEANGDVYVMGGFSQWQAWERNRMRYNKKRMWYEAVILLKQGYYNYTFGLKTNDSLQTNAFEGSSFQTENDYLVFFYKYSQQLNCDLLVGYLRRNSVVRIGVE